MEVKEKNRGAYMLLRHSSTMFRWIIICTVFERTCSKDGGIKYGDDDQQESCRKFSVGSWNSGFPIITLCCCPNSSFWHMKAPHHQIAPENIISTVLGNNTFGSRKCGQFGFSTKKKYFWVILLFMCLISYIILNFRAANVPQWAG